MNIGDPPAVVDDGERVAEVDVLAWQAGYRNLLPQPRLDALQPAQRVPTWKAALAESEWPRRGALVAAFYVLPEAWGRGVGRRLLAGVVQALRSAGYRTATLWTLEANARAHRFYSGNGWTLDGTVEAAFAGDVAVRYLRYRRDLAGPG